ncbi:PAS domain S-box protein [Methanoculleus sp. FWC-SCC1]|uniref:histidine kinase n=1 Tax=Methanoculleus frigidifontis TaxID=2584085 RepID=A0ABT8MAD4_9EURY|nr:PAS domain S-box protein [Methanoculleus sp. FWC-SCC1]MDN7024898.1 PAS domain S-box protein [Methanoculleus sp. FWC-SCC1]
MITVLHVDDEPALLDITRLFLERKSDISVTIVTSAEEALTTLQHQRFDAIVSDYEMPRMNGIEFLKRLKAEGNDTPFIIFTGRGREHVIIEALNNGASFYLQKGGDPKSQFAELKHMIEQAVERKRMDEALRASEERYRAVVESQTELICRFRPDGMLVFANDAFCHYYGRPKCSELVGTRFFPAIPKDEHDLIREHFSSLTPANPVGNVEHRVIMPDGTIRWQQWSDRALFDDERRVIEYQSVGRDVTDRKRAEEALKDSETRFKVLAEKSLVGVYIVRNGIFTYVNPRFAHIFGYRVDEMVGVRGFDDLALADDLAVVRDMLQKMRTGAEGFPHFEFRGVRKDGETITAEVYGSETAIQGSQDIIGTLLDISDRKKMEVSLKEKVNYVQALMDTIPAPVFYRDTDGIYQDCNRAFEELVGLPKEEILGKTIWDFFPRFYADHYKYKDDLIIEQPHVQRYEFELQNTRGEKYDVLFSKTALFRADGSVAGIVGVIVDISDRKKMEVSLKEKVNYVQALMDTIPAPVFYRDTDGIYQDCNRAFEELVGLRKDEILGKTIHYFFPKEYADVYKEKDDLIIHHPHIQRYEFGITDAHGSVHDVLFSKTALFKADGAIAGIVGAILDISDRKKMEVSLKEKVNYVQALMDTIPAPVFYRDTDGIYQDCNRAFEELVGLPKEEILGKTIWDFFPRFYADHYKYKDDLIIEQPHVQRYEYELQNTRGEKYDVLFSKTALFRADGSVAGIVGVILDISDRKKMEKALRESEENFRMLADFTYDWEAWLGPEGSYLYVSPSCERITGYAAEAFLADPHLTEKICHPADREAVAHHYAETWRSSSGVHHLDFRIVTRGGELRWISHYCQPVYREDGTWIGRRENRRDITERKRVEEALQQANRKLNLLSSVTRHDVLNQLTALAGYLELSRDCAGGPLFFEMIQKAEQAADTIRHQIMFTKDYQDIGVHTPTWQNLNEVIGQTAAVRNAGDNVALTTSNADVEVYADPLLQKVFFNLLDNSLRHGGDISRITFSCAETGDGLTVVCEDDGSGIPETEKNRIFERGRGRNTGYGLFLAQEILSITGLSIRETGTPGNGARFEIHVPRGAYRFIAGRDAE